MVPFKAGGAVLLLGVLLLAIKCVLDFIERKRRL
jgi:hypothetical protein